MPDGDIKYCYFLSLLVRYITNVYSKFINFVTWITLVQIFYEIWGFNVTDGSHEAINAYY